MKNSINEKVDSILNRLSSIEGRLFELNAESKSNSSVIKQFFKKEDPNIKLEQCITQYKRLESTLADYKGINKLLNKQLAEKSDEIKSLTEKLERINTNESVNDFNEYYENTLIYKILKFFKIEKGWI